MKIVLAGGTGFIGRALVRRLLERGDEVVLLSRNKAKGAKGAALDFLTYWDGQTAGAWAKHADGADAMINLAGEPIAAGRWTKKRKEKLLNSRVDATRAFVENIKGAARRPPVFLNASAVGYYGNVPDGDVTEAHSRGSGFLAELCERWEQEALLASSLTRTVLLRIGVVLGPDGGALPKMLLPFKFFAGGHPGSGRQWFPWIHRDDAAGAILFALDHPEVSGPVNVTAPQPLTMKEFCKALGRALHRPSWAPVPSFVLRLMLGEMSGLLLDGQRALPKKLLDASFRFRYPAAPEALSMESLDQKRRDEP